MIPLFALRLICGLSAMWCAAPRREITSGFFRIQMLLTLGMSALLAVTAWQVPHPEVGTGKYVPMGLFAVGIGLAFASFLGSIAWTLERRQGGFLFALLVLVISTAGVAISAVTLTRQGESSATRVADSLTSAGLIGSVTATMLLGHWYLTATGMSLTPLVNYVRIFGGAVVVRIVAWLLIGTGGPESGFLYILRWAGLIGPAVLVPVTLGTLRYRNTQSATGVLYAATILVFMGEAAAALLDPMQINPTQANSVGV
jgi:hypothetical protein